MRRYDIMRKQRSALKNLITAKHKLESTGFHFDSLHTLKDLIDEITNDLEIIHSRRMNEC